jgi:L-alanine-DL-glutamate epimerase-like enolase superfamily enzyme
MTAQQMFIVGAQLYLLPVQTRVPLKFGNEVLTTVTVARCRISVRDAQGKTAHGWGESPLSVQWGWPASSPYELRHQAMQLLTQRVGEALVDSGLIGHALEIGYCFQRDFLPRIMQQFQLQELPTLLGTTAHMPHLAMLLCLAPWDLALHDAYGNLVERDIYDTYTAEFLSRDLSHYLEPVPATQVSFQGKYPVDYLVQNVPTELKAWHLVGGLDPLSNSDLTGQEPNDGYPVLLADWIRQDGLKCLKIKLRGNDATWDYERIVSVGEIAVAHDVEWLTTDFNCTVHDPAYVNQILDRLRDEYPHLYGMLLYVEQPFPYELSELPIDVHSVSARKPLFLDESAHDWTLVRLGRELGWTGVALKTCKTQTGALLSLCWAKAHGMTLMVQDLTNPMLAQIPHVRLAAHAGTIQGVETNGMQFYPQASAPEAAIHPGLYQRRAGIVDMKTLGKTGFGYRIEEIARTLPKPVWQVG